MTAVPLTIEPHRRRPVWRGLSWVTWRQYRAALLFTAAVFGGLAVYLLLSGWSMHRDFSKLGLTSCGSLTGAGCQVPLTIFDQRYQSVAMYLPRFLEFLPALLGAFLGAPLVARELESGTYRFAWTQGRNRVQWLISRLVIIAVVLTGLGLGFSLLFGWWFQPWNPIMGRLGAGQAYEISGVVFAARILFGFCLGAALGALIRRTVPAMLATIAVWLAVTWPSVVFLRPLIEKPVSVPSSSNALADNGWAISNWYQNSAGHHLTSNRMYQLLIQARHVGVTTGDAFQSFLARLGWTQWSSYQPNGRFWHFQVIEGAAYLILAMVLAAVAVKWVSRRAT
jgi:hypothetical protein